MLEADAADGETLHAPLEARASAATIHDSVLYDRENSRRDGGARRLIRHSPLEGVALPEGLRELPFLAQIDLRLDAADAGHERPSELSIGRCRSNRTLSTAEPKRPSLAGSGRMAGSSAHRTARPTLRRSSTPPSATVGASPSSTSANRSTLRAPRAAQPASCSNSAARSTSHPRAFGPGRCAQTLLARANVLIWQTPTNHATRRLVRPASFAAYLAAWLTDAANGLID